MFHRFTVKTSVSVTVTVNTLSLYQQNFYRLISTLKPLPVYSIRDDL